MKRLSVIIVTYKSEGDIYDCLQALYDHCDISRKELEVIIVDNSPECEPMFSKIREQFGEEIILIHNTHNGGYGQGNNVGIRKASAPVLLIMNPDVRLFMPIFKTALETFEKDNKLSIYGMKQMNNETSASPYSFICTYMMNGYVHTLLSSLCNRVDLYLPRYMYFSGSCFFIRKDLFEAIGLFDENIFMYGEEDDIRVRIMKRFGANFRYNRHLRYIHPMNDRKPDIEYEKKLIDVAIVQNEKHGYPRAKTLKNRLRNINILLWKAKAKALLFANNKDYIHYLQQRKDYIKQLQGKKQ